MSHNAKARKQIGILYFFEIYERKLTFPIEDLLPRQNDLFHDALKNLHMQIYYIMQ